MVILLCAVISVCACIFMYVNLKANEKKHVKLYRKLQSQVNYFRKHVSQQRREFLNRRIIHVRQNATN